MVEEEGVEVGVRAISWGLSGRCSRQSSPARSQRFSVLLISVFASLGLFSCSRKSPRLPPIVFVVFDTTRADHLSAYGYSRNTTPVLSELIDRDAVRFTRALAASNNTSCSHASMFTGLYVQHHGVFQLSPKGFPLAEAHTTLAEALRDRGYHTVAAVGAAHLNPEYSGFGQGFETFLSCPSAGDGPKRSAEATTTELIAELERDYTGCEERPLFLWLHYFDPHRPYDPPTEYVSAFDSRGYEVETPDCPEGFFFPGEGDRAAREVALGNEIAALTSRYDAEIRRADAELGRVLEALDRLGQLDDAIFVFTADHGENLGEKNLYFNHGGLHSPVVDIPLAMRIPGLTKKGDCEEMVHHIDLMPTLLDAVGVPLEERPSMDGESLLPLFKGESFPASRRRFSDAANFREKAVCDGRFKLIYDEPHQKISLFDLLEDPEEIRDLSGSEPERTAQFLRELESYAGSRDLQILHKASDSVSGREVIEGSLRGVSSFEAIRPVGLSPSDSVIENHRSDHVGFRFSLEPGQSKGFEVRAPFGPVLLDVSSDRKAIRSAWCPPQEGKGRPEGVIPSFPVVLAPRGEIRGEKAPSDEAPVACFQEVEDVGEGVRYRFTMGPIPDKVRQFSFLLGTSGSFSEVKGCEGRLGYKDLGGGNRFRVGTLNPGRRGVFQFVVTPRESLVLVEGLIGEKSVANLRYRISDWDDPTAYPTTMLLSRRVSAGSVFSTRNKNALERPGLHVLLGTEREPPRGGALDEHVRRMIAQLGYAEND